MIFHFFISFLLTTHIDRVSRTDYTFDVATGPKVPKLQLWERFNQFFRIFSANRGIVTCFNRIDAVIVVILFSFAEPAKLLPLTTAYAGVVSFRTRWGLLAHGVDDVLLHGRADGRLLDTDEKVAPSLEMDQPCTRNGGSSELGIVVEL